LLYFKKSPIENCLQFILEDTKKINEAIHKYTATNYKDIILFEKHKFFYIFSQLVK